MTGILAIASRRRTRKLHRRAKHHSHINSDGEDSKVPFGQQLSTNKQLKNEKQETLEGADPIEGRTRFYTDQQLSRFRHLNSFFSPASSPSIPPCLCSPAPAPSPESSPSLESKLHDCRDSTATPPAPRDRRLAHPPTPLTPAARNLRSSPSSPSSPSAPAPTSSSSSLAPAPARPPTKSQSHCAIARTSHYPSTTTNLPIKISHRPRSRPPQSHLQFQSQFQFNITPHPSQWPTAPVSPPTT